MDTVTVYISLQAEVSNFWPSGIWKFLFIYLFSLFPFFFYKSISFLANKKKKMADFSATWVVWVGDTNFIHLDLFWGPWRYGKQSCLAKLIPKFKSMATSPPLHEWLEKAKIIECAGSKDWNISFYCTWVAWPLPYISSLVRKKIWMSHK